jgi:putative ABC transport system substrate-binding protein
MELQEAANALGLELTFLNASNEREIDAAFATIMRQSGGITAFAREPNGGLLVPPSTLATIHRDLIIKLAARYKLPAVYPHRFFVASGGLISFGPNRTDQYRLAARYIDRILKGEKPGDLPVQAPVKYDTAINLNTAKALGLTIPETLLATADEVIQ